MVQEKRAINLFSSMKMLGIALVMYLIWTFATYILEGRILLLNTGDPLSRFVYALIANILIGIVIIVFIINQFRTGDRIPREYFGFQPLKRTVISVLVAFILGFIIFLVSSPQTLNPVVILNVFAQVFNTSTAEILVVYILVGAAGACIVRSHGRIPSALLGTALAAILFGMYHIAHSPPFNTVSMILLLTFIGAITGVYFFLVREMYSTIVFHNFFALIGVTQNINIANYQAPNIFLLVMMLVTLVFLVAMDLYFIRSKALSL